MYEAMKMKNKETTQKTAGEDTASDSSRAIEVAAV